MSEGLQQQVWTEFAKGDADVWRDFVRSQAPQLFQMFMSRWPNPALAEELVAKTVFDAVKGLSSFDGSKGSPEGWIHGIAQNNIRIEIRKRANSLAINGDISLYLESIDKGPLPEEVLEKAETADLVRNAMARLDSKENDVLRAKYIEGLSAQQIAKRIALTEKAVHSLLYRARISLRSELKRLCPRDKEGQKL